MEEETKAEEGEEEVEAEEEEASCMMGGLTGGSFIQTLSPLFCFLRSLLFNVWLNETANHIPVARTLAGGGPKQCSPAAMPAKFYLLIIYWGDAGG